MSERKQVLSCIQPTGHLHYGNYFGAVKNWAEMQENYDCIFGIVDYHAITMPYDVKKLRQNIWELAINLVAVGLKPENVIVQSLVPEHAELAWIFNCFCSYGQLTRMTQFKDKSQDDELKTKDSFISSGLLTYPVLQAADILIYKADYVPIGQDQGQHLELTRDIAQRFNHIIGKEYFVLPEALYTQTPKIKSTADPKRKMSKSAGEKHYINIFSDEQRIRKQIRSAVTDIGETNSEEMSPGIKNLFEILKASGEDRRHGELMSIYADGNLKYVDLKQSTADALVTLSKRFSDRKQELNANKRALKKTIRESSERVRKKAQETVREVKDLVGLLNV